MENYPRAEGAGGQAVWGGSAQEEAAHERSEWSRRMGWVKDEESGGRRSGHDRNTICSKPPFLTDQCNAAAGDQASRILNIKQ